MQGHVLIADWSVAYFVVIMNDVMNDNMAAFAHVGALLYKSLFTKLVVAKKHIHTYKYEEKQQKNKRNIASKYATLLTQIKRNMV